MGGILLLALLLPLEPNPGGRTRLLGPEEGPPPIVQTGVDPSADPNAPLLAANPMISDAMRADARLTDAFFIDAEYGWAVGDRGTILATQNGGRQWQLQHSGVACPLKSVFFIDRQTGWAAGGFARPYTHSSVGVVLVTSDGGRTWYNNPNLLLPAIRQIRFFNTRQGVAIGCPAAMFSSGIFTTENGGQSWASASGEATEWLCGAFLTPQIGVVAGRDGRAAVIRGGAAGPAETSGLGLGNLWRVRLAPKNTGWLCGDAGVLLTTTDAGLNWQPPRGAFPQEVAKQFDFRALAVSGTKVWAAGSPGTRVLHTADGGKKWESFPTGVNTPIESLAFADDTHGWAVGALGVILATEDGGRTWRKQCSGGARAAVLGLVALPEDIPLELFSRLSGNDGYLGVAESLVRNDLEVKPRGEVHALDRAAEALLAVGGSLMEQSARFPIRQSGLKVSPRQILDLWDRANEGHGQDALHEHLVRQIRAWRPSVVVTHDASPRGDDPLGHLVNQAVLRAVRDADDATVFPRQIGLAGLAPWKTMKVYAMLPPGVHGSVDLTTAQLASRLGRSVADIADATRGLIEENFRAAPPSLGFQLVLNQLSQDQSQRDFFSGLALKPKSDARRELNEPPPGSFVQLRRAAEKRRNIQAILERLDRDPQGGSQILGQMGELTLGLDRDGAVQILYQLADRYRRLGHGDTAADTFAMLAQRYADHPLADSAMAWLVQYHSGSEPHWQSAGGLHSPGQAPPIAVADTAILKGQINRAIALGKEIDRTRPSLLANPAVRFSLTAAARRCGVKQTDRVFASPGRDADSEAWRSCAYGETWLAERRGRGPKAVMHCTAASSRPKLDGVLDDAIWQQAIPVTLDSQLKDDQQWPAAVMMAFDEEFLYIGIECQKAPGVRYDFKDGPRPRDADVADRDRVEIYIDIDRDFSTWYKLSVDHRGWVADECWGNRVWNPSWFVAARVGSRPWGDASADRSWSVEAAIPLNQLSGEKPARDTAWAVGLQRVVPSVGFQSFSHPAGVRVVPEGFGYLLFDGEARGVEKADQDGSSKGIDVVPQAAGQEP